MRASELTYTITVTHPTPTPWARFVAWLRGRSPQRAVTYFPPCPTCCAPVSAAIPRIRQGAEFTRGAASWKGNDELIGFRLEPCQHEVDKVVMWQGTPGDLAMSMAIRETK